jgi:hypothetical protein
MPITISGSTGVAGVDGSAGTPAIQGTDTNTGIYFPGADRVGITEGGVQVAEFDASGNFQFNSGYGSVATAYGCRAWVNFNGTGTVAIRASGNVTSITDNGLGDYTLNFTTALVDANYAVSGASGGQNNTSNGAVYQYDQLVAKTTLVCRIATLSTAGSPVDTPQIAVSIHR